MQRIISQYSSNSAFKVTDCAKKITALTTLSLALISLPVFENTRAFAGPIATSVANLYPIKSNPSLTIKPSIIPVSASVKSVVIINQKLNSLLADFAQRQGLALKISKKIRTRVKSKVLPSEPVKFLNALAKFYPIDWYQMGNELFISQKKERVTRLINIGSISPKQIKSDIEASVMNAKSFSFSSIKGSKSILLSGPPTYVAFVELVIKGNLQNSQRDKNIHIYKGGFEVSTK